VNLDSTAAAVIGDVAVITIAASLLGALARRCGQPTVVGQIIAGIVLGPSLLGRLPGNPTEFLFPMAVRPFLAVLSQVAIVLFMFVVAYEIDPRMLRAGGRAAALVATLALFVPMGLGAGVVRVLHTAFEAANPQGAQGNLLMLFMAVATSITALPVLAAIVRERGLAGRRGSTVATAAAGAMDLGAWLLLAAVLTRTHQGPHRSWGQMLVLIGAFVAIMTLVVRPALGWWTRRPGAVLTNQVPVALGLAFGCAWFTASIGLHPIFGGFLAGLIMPRHRGMPEVEVLESMEKGAGLLLPLFFVTTGLSANIGRLSQRDLIPLAVILAAAIAGKIIPAYVAARISRLDRRESALVAALVNTRGLTELIALQVGLSAGIIGPELFTVLVLVALITTLMTSPLLVIVGFRRPAETGDREAGEHGTPSRIRTDM
jgi:Kef-type K+ transport system membrane component KefB